MSRWDIGRPAPKKRLSAWALSDIDELQPGPAESLTTWLKGMTAGMLTISRIEAQEMLTTAPADRLNWN